MPRYFIDTDDGDRLQLDQMGFELPDQARAREAALSALPDMAREKIPDGDRRVFVVTVRDESRSIYRASLSLTGEWLVPPGSDPRVPR